MFRISLLLALSVAMPVGAAEWGGLRGQIVVRGDVPEGVTFDLGRDACCLAARPTDRSIVVGEEGGLAGVIVYLKAKRGIDVPLETLPPTEPVEISNIGCAFAPRITLLRAGQPLVLVNDDPTTHNVKATTRRNGEFNLILPPDDRRELRLEVAERSPVTLSCNIHPFMRGFLLVRDDPYAVVTGPDGEFALPRLPAGKWRFEFWHERGELAGIKLADGETDGRGRAELTIPVGETLDLGELHVPADHFKNNKR